MKMIYFLKVIFQWRHVNKREQRKKFKKKLNGLNEKIVLRQHDRTNVLFCMCFGERRVTGRCKQ